MTAPHLSKEEKQILLRLARQSIQLAVAGMSLPVLDLETLPPRLLEPGASFVTLTNNGRLRGCIGALEAYQPLVEDVREHAVAAATQDYRFPPVTPAEAACLQIEISYLTCPNHLSFTCSDDLISHLHPGQDGLILSYAGRKATFLPQVWEKIPDPEDFLSSLCNKMGMRSDLWRREKVEVFTYEVEAFEEAEFFE